MNGQAYISTPQRERRSYFADSPQTGFWANADWSKTAEGIAWEGIRSGRFAVKKHIKLKDVLKAVGQAAMVAGGAIIGAVAADKVMDNVQGGNGSATLHADSIFHPDMRALTNYLPSHNVVYAAADHPTIVNRISHILSSARGGDEAIEVYSPRKRYHDPRVQAAPALQSAECQTADAVGQRENPSQVFYKINPENCVVDAIKLMSLLNIDGYSKLSAEEQERYLTRTLGAKKSADGGFYIFVNGDKEIVFKRPGIALEVDIGFRPVVGNYFAAIINAGVFRSALEKSLEPSSKYITPVYPTPTQDKGFIFGDWLSGGEQVTPAPVLPAETVDNLEEIAGAQTAVPGNSVMPSEKPGGNGQDVVDFFILPAIGAALLYTAWIFKQIKNPDYIKKLISKAPKKS